MMSNIEDVPLISVSFVSITLDLVKKVSDRTGRSVEAVQAYLKGPQQDDDLLRAFLFFGVGPINKTFRPV